MDVLIFLGMFLILLMEAFFLWGYTNAIVIPFVVSVVYILFRCWLGKKLTRRQQIIGRGGAIGAFGYLSIFVGAER